MYARKNPVGLAGFRRGSKSVKASQTIFIFGLTGLTGLTVQELDVEFISLPQAKLVAWLT